MTHARLETHDDPLPQPPIPSETNLRNYLFTPIYRARLFGSSFHARVSDGEWRAGVTLWLKSQDQVPAGSLPNDDLELCRLAELGRDVEAWQTLRAGALRGWFKCADGRLYHPVVTEIVLNQIKSIAAQKQRTHKARMTVLQKRKLPTSATAVAEPATELVTESNRMESNEIQRNEIGASHREEPTASIAATSRTREAAVALPRCWIADALDRNFASRMGLSSAEIAREQTKFAAYWSDGKGGRTRRTAKGWRTTWQNWISKLVERGLSNGQRSSVLGRNGFVELIRTGGIEELARTGRKLGQAS